MFAKDKKFAFEATQPDRVRTGTGWCEDRRAAPDPRLGRRKSDAHFPYNPSFVAQALAQGPVNPGTVAKRDGAGPVCYRGVTRAALSGRFVKLVV